MKDRCMRIYTILAFVFLLYACDETGRFVNEPTDIEVEKFYQSNRLMMGFFVQFCTDHKDVKWLRVEPYRVDWANSKKGVELEYAILDIKQKMKSLELNTLSCTRDWSLPDAPLILVTIPLYGVGISVSGSSKGLKYITRNASRATRSRFKSDEFKKLEDEGWFIYSIAM